MSVLPQQVFVKAIGGNKVNISLMVKQGSSPHTYEPKPSQMKNISKADIYFKIGIEFEKAWIPRFKNQNQNMQVIDSTKNIKKYSNDPHIWTSPKNMKIVAKNIYDVLIKIDKKNQSYYKNNYDNFILNIQNTDNQIKKILKNVPKGTKFMVFHPAWGYFARDYGLTQLPIEVEGKSPKPRQIALIINKARKENIKIILTAPEFSTKVANSIANELNIRVIKITPLNPNWSQNLINLAKVIGNQ